jgi:sugar/nucleoside kinase (ribokinase family)
MSLVVTGTIGIDTVYVPTGEHREGILGGSCAYFAAAASVFGPVSVVAVVGEDFPPAMRAVLAGFTNVDLAGLETREGGKTFRWGGKYMKNMDQRETLFTELGVLEGSPPDVPHALRSAGFVFLANSHPGVQYHLLSQFADPVLAVADTMDLWINIARDDLEVLMSHVDGLVLNYDEAELLTGSNSPVTAGRRILELGPRFVVIKKGEHGAILVHQDGIAALPAFPSERVIDPTGAGDTFAAGMMAALASEHKAGRNVDPGSFESIRRAMAHGTIAASFTIEAFSLDRLKNLRLDEVNERFDQYAAMMRLA